MVGLVSICCCAGGRLMSDVFRQAFALSSAHCSVLEGLNVVWLVSTCLLGRPSAYCSIHLS